MNNILFFIGLFLVLVLSGSYLIIIWKKEKIKLFKQQMQESFKMANEFADIIKKPTQDVLNEFKKENDKVFMRKNLELKLDVEDKIKNTDNEAISRLIETGMTEQEAKEFLRGV